MQNLAKSSSTLGMLVQLTEDPLLELTSSAPENSTKDSWEKLEEEISAQKLVVADARAGEFNKDLATVTDWDSFELFIEKYKIKTPMDFSALIETASQPEELYQLLSNMDMNVRLHFECELLWDFDSYGTVNKVIPGL